MMEGIAGCGEVEVMQQYALNRWKDKQGEYGKVKEIEG
jgi:hypothetical protein